jgi:hypothetical protein
MAGIGMEVNGKAIVFYQTEEVILEVDKFYSTEEQLELPEGFKWVDYGLPNKKRLEMITNTPDLPNVIEVQGETFVVGEIYPGHKQYPLPKGYRWGSMRYGLDGHGGINHKLEYD